jgi:hypothetical protein
LIDIVRSGKKIQALGNSATRVQVASAIPIAYQGKNGKQYVAIVAAVGGAPRSMP